MIKRFDYLLLFDKVGEYLPVKLIGSTLLEKTDHARIFAWCAENLGPVLVNPDNELAYDGDEVIMDDAGVWFFGLEDEFYLSDSAKAETFMIFMKLIGYDYSIEVG